jgi:hypothetical protein
VRGRARRIARVFGRWRSRAAARLRVLVLTEMGVLLAASR